MNKAGIAITMVVLALFVACTGDEPTGTRSAAHSVADAGPPEVDAGPPEVDAGPPEVDAGPPEVDGGTPPVCTRTPGYWKNHFEEWDDVSLTIGSVTYSPEALLLILRTPPRGDASLILAHHLIAAILNGGEADPDISGVIDDAQDWMTDNDDGNGLPFGVRTSTAAGAEAVELAGDLADYNEGFTGPGHCD